MEDSVPVVSWLQEKAPVTDVPLYVFLTIWNQSKLLILPRVNWLPGSSLKVLPFSHREIVVVKERTCGWRQCPVWTHLLSYYVLKGTG